jgi:MFS superfamily sulfate permease-like transporter
MIGLGVANLAAGFFKGFPISSSSSRTPVAEVSGARTQLTGVVGAVAIALLLLFAPNLMQNLPTSALAAVVIAAPSACSRSATCAASTASSVGSSGCRSFVWPLLPCWVRSLASAWLSLSPSSSSCGTGWRPHFAVLGRVDGIRGYHDLKRYPDARLVPGLVLFRWDAPLFFANAELFQARVLEAVASSPTPVRRVVVTAEPVTSVDVTSADMLAELEQTLRASRIELQFAEVKDPVKDKLKRFGLLDQIGTDAFHPTIGAAVDAYLAKHAVDWKP